MNSRVLSIINTVGCVVLVGFVIFQWTIGDRLEREAHKEKAERIRQTNARMEAEKRASSLESDIHGLKASIEAIRAESSEQAKELVEREKEASELYSGLLQTQEQMKIMAGAITERDEAIKARDERLKEAGEALVATRKRLDEAVAKLKEAAKRE